MLIHTESKVQGWRALAIFKDRAECLLFVGRSTTQIRSGYRSAFEEILDEEERDNVESISLQCWEGAPDRGHWVPKSTLAVPGREKLVLGKPLALHPALALLAGEALGEDESDMAEREILPFAPTAAESEDPADRILASRRRVVSR